MTFEKWWQDNSKKIWVQIALFHPTAAIKKLFKDCWHDGYVSSAENHKKKEVKK